MVESNFGRRLKELKRARSVGYTEISNVTQIRRDRLIALEENEVAPTDAERHTLADFYQVSPEELGASLAPVLPPEPEQPTSNGALETPGSDVRLHDIDDDSHNYRIREVDGNSRTGGYRSRDAESGNRQSEYRSRDTEFRRPPVRNGGMSGRLTPTTSGPERRSGLDQPRLSGNAPSPQKRKPQTKNSSGQEALGDMESGFLRKQQDTRTPMVFHFINGKTFTGLVTGFTPYVIIIRDETSGEEIVMRKLAIAYYEKKEGAPPA